MTTATRVAWRSGWALAVLAAVLAVLVAVFGAPPASAATGPAAQNGVGASHSTVAVLVGPSTDISEGQRLGNDPPQAQIVVATGVHAMTETTTAKTWISDTLKAAGLRGRGSVWRMKGQDVQWVVHIDELPYDNRLGVDIGLDLQVGTTPQRPTDCPVLLHLENAPPAGGYEVVAALDLDSGLAPDRRRHELEAVARDLAAYLAEHLTMSAVRAAYRAGNPEAAFIHKDARATLESGEGR